MAIAIDRVLCELNFKHVVTDCVRKSTAHESLVFPRIQKIPAI